MAGSKNDLKDRLTRPSDQSVVADLIFRQERDEEEDEEDNEDDGKKDDDNEDDSGYSE
jgi:hypothetical protein